MLPEFGLRVYRGHATVDLNRVYILLHNPYYANSMPRKRQLRPDAEIAVHRTAEPVLVNGGQTVKSLSAAFLADLEDDWRQHGKQIFSVLRDKYPQAYFGGLVALSKVIRWDVGVAGEFDRSLTPEEIMDRLEKRVGPEGRKLFEQFLRKVNKLQMQQHLEVRAQGDTER